MKSRILFDIKKAVIPENKISNCLNCKYAGDRRIKLGKVWCIMRWCVTSDSTKCVLKEAISDEKKNPIQYIQNYIQY